MIRTALALLLFSPSVALAGDPCPIDFEVTDLGVPSWLDRATILDGMESKDSWVGISFKDAKVGVEVQAVSTGSPAAAAGLKVGDVITEAAGLPVKDHTALAHLFRDTRPGALVALGLADGRALTLTLGRQDAFVGALIDHISAQECARVRRGEISPAAAEKLRALLFTPQRRFRCDDAHAALAGQLQGGDLLVVRGSKRVLVTSPGFATACFYSKSADGKALTPKRLAEIFKQVAGPYIADRHANP